MSGSLAHAKWVQSQNGGPTKLAEWIPEAFGGEGGWRVQGRPEVMSRGHFLGNYKFVDDRARSLPNR